MRAAVGRACARAALAGNPSDGYGGRTLAVTVRDLSAVVTIGAGDATGNGNDLTRAAMTRFARLTGIDLDGVAVSCETTIPRTCGLAGSSAIVTATLRALAAAHDLTLDTATLAAEALAAEVEELGIAAGPQDRVVQALEGLVHMDFATSVHEPLPVESLPPLFLAWRTTGGAPSGGVHSDLRQRHSNGDRTVHDGMATLAGLAATARDALLAGDHRTFAACMDASFDARASMIELDPADTVAVGIARDHGCAVNFAGSGGAVVGTLPPAGLDRLAADLRRAGWAAIRPTL